MRSPRTLITVVSALAIVTIAALPARAADTTRVVTSADIPASLGAVPAGTPAPVMSLPSHGVLQVCTVSMGNWQQTIAGPRHFSQVLIPTNLTSIASVSELAYEYTSTAAAEQAWKRLYAAAKKCDRTQSLPAPDGGRLTTRIDNGYLPGITPYLQLWINEHVTDVAKNGKTSGNVAQFAVFTQAGNAILVTKANALDLNAFSPAQRSAIGALAQTLSERWATGR